MTAFVTVNKNPDVWVNPEPQGLWARVAVCSRWGDAEKTAKRWGGKPAVVGPLRTKVGVDLLVRDLLANPQVTCLIIDGPDLLPSNGALAALERLFLDDNSVSEELDDLVVDIDGEPVPLVPLMVASIGYVRATAAEVLHPTRGIEGIFEDLESIGLRPTVDRQGGRHVLPPPAPKAESKAPPGDSGERVAADTLAELWPQLLDRVLSFGRTVPTQYGDTKELLDVVSVIRDPVATLTEFGALDADLAHPVLQKSMKDLRNYYSFVTGSEVPTGAPYTYGSRLHGMELKVVPDEYIDHAMKMLDGGASLAGRLAACNEGVDQFGELRKLLTEKPDTRAAFVTPWRPEEDSGKESGRPCLVGVWFRSVPRTIDASRIVEVYVGDARPSTQPVHHPLEGGPGNYAACGMKGVPTDEPSAVTCRACLEIFEPRILHVTVCFRSHDLYGAYVSNLAALCLWLVEEANRQKMVVGSLTCISFSAHVYARDWNVARELVEANPPKGIAWDPRSSWRVEMVYDDEDPPKPLVAGEIIGDLSRRGQWEVLADPVEEGKHAVRLLGTNEVSLVFDHILRDARGDNRGPRKMPKIRAVAMEPGDGEAKVLATFEAQTPAALRSKIERSGLITSVGSALWLGDEIRRVGSGRP